MVAYEFSTQLTDNGTVIIPPYYRRNLNNRTPVRIILLVEDEGAAQADTVEVVDEPSVEEVVARIQQLGPNPANIKPASGLLGQHLAELIQESDPTFDLEQWQKEWDRIEAAMDADEAAHEQAEWVEWNMGRE